MSSTMVSGGGISRARWLALTIVVVLAVGLMVLWWTRGFGSLSSAHSDQKSEQSTVPNVDRRGGNATKAGARELEEKDKLSKVKESDSVRPPSRDIKIFGENGLVTTQAIESLNLTSQEVASLTRILATVKEQAAADFVSRTKLTENVPTENGGFRHTYFAKARPDRGAEFSNALAKECEALIGADRAQRINSDISSLNFLGGAGKYDLNIVVSSDGGEKVVKYESIDPKGGRVLETQECPYTAFSEAFGGVFSY